MRFRLCLFLLVMMIVTLGTSALATDNQYYWDFSAMTAQASYHYDASPWEGLFYMHVWNDTAVTWTDFHFELFQGDNVFFDSSPAPTASLLNYSYSISGAGRNVDYYFPASPVAPGGSVLFILSADNTASKYPMFGILGFPTDTAVVPEPASLLGLSSGLLGLGGLLLRKKR